MQQAIAHAKSQPWVQQQIAADLAPFKNGISEQQLEAWFKGLSGNFQYNELIKFKIVADKVSVYPSSVLSYKIAYQTIVEVVQILVLHQLIPDCEFIVSLSDYLYHVPTEIHEPVAVLSFAKHLQIPVEKNTILIPDWINIRDSDELRSRIKFANSVYPWHTKKDILHWRGGSADSMLHRRKLVVLGSKFNFLDVGMTGVVPEVDPEFSLQYKYQISLDGARCTWSRMVWQMQANTLMIKPDSPQVQWYFRGLEPYVNYLPIADVDEHNISTAYTWLKTHDSKAQEITYNANEFASNNFKTQDYIAYYALLLQEYAKLMVPAPDHNRNK